MSKYLIVIAGATATGKTAAAIDLAKMFQTEIISCDSRQFYREMNIGTAKPNEDDLNKVPHHFINNLSVHDNYSVGQYEKEVIAFLNDFYKNHDVAVLVGGTGLFIRAVCEGLDEFPDVPEKVKNAVENDYRQYGLEFLQRKLSEADPVYYQIVDQNNPARLMRALSVYESTGKPFSEFQSGKKAARLFIPIYICLELPRADLYERINDRVEVMLKKGLLNEVKGFWTSDFGFRISDSDTNRSDLRNPSSEITLSALQTVGYTELFNYLDKKISFAEAVNKIKQHTRNYAKRQITWFKKTGDWKYFSPNDFEDITAYIRTKIE